MMPVHGANLESGPLLPPQARCSSWKRLDTGRRPAAGHLYGQIAGAYLLDKET